MAAVAVVAVAVAAAVVVAVAVAVSADRACRYAWSQWLERGPHPGNAARIQTTWPASREWG